MSNDDDDDVYAFLFGIANLVALAGVVFSFITWLAGQLSSVFSGNGWPHSGPMHCLQVAFKFVQDPDDSHGAWPPVAVGAIGSAPLFFSFLVMLLTLSSVEIYFVGRLRLNIRRHRPIR